MRLRMHGLVWALVVLSPGVTPGPLLPARYASLAGALTGRDSSFARDADGR